MSPPPRYQIVFLKAAERDFDDLDRHLQKRVGRKIDGLANEPRPDGCMKLAGDENIYRIRIGDYRVLYVIEDSRVLVTVIRVGHRREIYRIPRKG